MHKMFVSAHFNGFITFLIFANAVVIGAQVQHTATSDAESWWYQLAEYMFTAIFTSELVIRMMTQRWKFFTSASDRYWNGFDSILVCVSLLSLALDLVTDTVLQESSSSIYLQLARAVRAIRILRIIRAVRFLNQLRIIIYMISNSLQLLFWILLILLGLIYVVGIILTQGAVDYIKTAGHKNEADHDLIHKHFGSLIASMYTLFQCISGGMNWGDAAESIRVAGWFWPGLLSLYIFFTVFTVLNIVNGVFVDRAIEVAKRDRLVILGKQKADDAAREAQLVDLLYALDADGDGKISFEEFCNGLELDEVRDYMTALQVEIHDVQEFFCLLDNSGDGLVDAVEFVTGMMKLRGEAKGSTVLLMLHHCRVLTQVVYGLVDIVHERLHHCE